MAMCTIINAGACAALLTVALHAIFLGEQDNRHSLGISCGRWRTSIQVRSRRPTVCDCSTRAVSTAQTMMALSITKNFDT